MKCINNELVQKYIDGETNSQETFEIEKHLSECAECAKKIDEQKAFVALIKGNTTFWDNQPVKIPEFIAPVPQKFKVNVKIRHLIYAVSAACVILLVVFLFPFRNVDEERHNNIVHLIYTIDGDFDANKTITQQEMKIIMIDSEGKIIEYF